MSGDHARLSLHAPWHAVTVYSLSSTCLRSVNHPLQGPHFADWQELAGAGAASLATVPILVERGPVAALTIASAQNAAFQNEQPTLLLAAVLAPLVATLKRTSATDELRAMVHGALMPLTAEAAVRQGRLSRAYGAHGVEVLLLDRCSVMWHGAGRHPSKLCELVRCHARWSETGPCVRSLLDRRPVQLRRLHRCCHAVICLPRDKRATPLSHTSDPDA